MAYYLFETITAACALTYAAAADTLVFGDDTIKAGRESHITRADPFHRRGGEHGSRTARRLARKQPRRIKI